MSESPSDVFFNFSSLSDHKLPLLEKIELRPNTDRMSLSRQQFTLRASFNSPKQRKSLFAKNQAYLAIQDEETRSYRRENINTAYRRCLLLARVSSSSRLLENEITLSKKQLDITEKTLASGRSADLSDYLSLKTEILALSAQADEKKLQFHDMLRLMGGDTLTENLSLLLAPGEIMQLITDLQLDTSQLYETKIKQAQLQYLDAAYKSEKSEASKIFDFVQARYTVRDDLLPENRFSLGFGLMFPYKGSLKPQLAEIIARKKIAQRDIAVVTRETTEQFKFKKQEFFQKMGLYNQLKSIPGDARYLDLKSKILESGKLDPIKMFEVEKDELDIDKKANEAFFNLIDLYLQLLHLSGKLYQEPYRNYLQSGFPLIF